MTTRLACSQLFHPACKISQAGVGDVCYELVREDTHTYVHPLPIYVCMVQHLSVSSNPV